MTGRHARAEGGEAGPGRAGPGRAGSGGTGLVWCGTGGPGGVSRSDRPIAPLNGYTKVVANCPVCMMPLRSSITFRSCGLVAVLMASSRLMDPSAMSVTRDWSKVCMP